MEILVNDVRYFLSTTFQQESLNSYDCYCSTPAPQYIQLKPIHFNRILNQPNSLRFLCIIEQIFHSKLSGFVCIMFFSSSISYQFKFCFKTELLIIQTWSFHLIFCVQWESLRDKKIMIVFICTRKKFIHIKTKS